jgi:flagellum-specific peptidoglycan hydrolase FlgJ
MRLFIWFFIFCPIMVFGQKWQSYTNTQKVNVAKQVSAQIYANIEQHIPEYRRPFIQRFGWLAVYDYNEYGVLASVKIAQGGLECGWGLILDRGLQGNNYFSIKCREKKHNQGNCFVLNDGGEPAHFVKYSTAFDSFRGHTMHLKTYYNSIFKYTRYQDWAYVLGKRYAIDKKYGGKLISIIKDHHLYEYDIKI